MICPKCGSSLGESAQFCPRCGTALAQSTVTEEPAFTNPVLDMRVDAFLKQNGKYFRKEDLPIISEELRASDLDAVSRAESQHYKNPTLARILSIFPFTGFLGNDRFYAGGKANIIIGFIKLVTSGGAMLLWFFDLVNMSRLVQLDNGYRALLGRERSLGERIEGIKQGLSSPEFQNALENLKQNWRNRH